mmetsp:Transcript_36017/g.61805  ORF Transcript_36017/g.61805 Transcript_36017/m.61805 type:complete len:237 (-) Transcript_36017:118-828(-)
MPGMACMAGVGAAALATTARLLSLCADSLRFEQTGAFVPPPYCRTVRDLAAAASKTVYVSGVTPSHLNAGLQVAASLTFSIILSEVSTLQISYSRRTFVFIAPGSGSPPSTPTPRSWKRRERAASSSERMPSSATESEAWRKRPTNLTDSSRIDFSFRPSFSFSVYAGSIAGDVRPPSSPFSLPEGSSVTSLTGGSPWARRSRQAASLDMPNHWYAAARSSSRSTTSSDSSTFTMS